MKNDKGILNEMGFSDEFRAGAAVGVVAAMTYAFPVVILVLLFANTDYQLPGLLGGSIIYVIVFKLTHGRLCRSLARKAQKALDEERKIEE